MSELFCIHFLKLTFYALSQWNGLFCSSNGIFKKIRGFYFALFPAKKIIYGYNPVKIIDIRP